MIDIVSELRRIAASLRSLPLMICSAIGKELEKLLGLYRRFSLLLGKLTPEVEKLLESEYVLTCLNYSRQSNALSFHLSVHVDKRRRLKLSVEICHCSHMWIGSGIDVAIEQFSSPDGGYFAYVLRSDVLLLVAYLHELNSAFQELGRYLNYLEDTPGTLGSKAHQLEQIANIYGDKLLPTINNIARLVQKSLDSILTLL